MQAASSAPLLVRGTHPTTTTLWCNEDFSESGHNVAPAPSPAANRRGRRFYIFFSFPSLAWERIKGQAELGNQCRFQGQHGNEGEINNALRPLSRFRAPFGGLSRSSSSPGEFNQGAQGLIYRFFRWKGLAHIRNEQDQIGSAAGSFQILAAHPRPQVFATILRTQIVRFNLLHLFLTLCGS